MSGRTDGASFILDAPSEVPAVWGRGSEALWAKGESLYLTGPPGVGKSTVAQQLVAARLGLTDQCLGFHVERDDLPVLYLALDRPPQIRRSMARMFTEEHRQVLAEKLVIHQGAFMYHPEHPQRLAEQVAGFGTLIIDSLKDLATPLTSDEVAASVTKAIGRVLEGGCEVVVIHHHRKANSDNKKPANLADVYGSAWLTAGAGSVVTLWGEAGDPVVEMLHLKQPADEIGPLELEHDHEHGRTTRRERLDEWRALQRSPLGISAHDVAAAVHEHEPSRAEVEKARRRLDRMVRDGRAKRTDGSKLVATLYTPTVMPRDGEREGSDPHHADHHDPSRTRSSTDHAPSRAAAHATTHHAPLKEWGARDGSAARTESNGHAPLNALVADLDGDW